MWFHSCTVYLVVTVFCLPSITAQTIQPRILCANETAPGHSSGIIQYPPEGSDRDCTLTLTGFVGDYISLPKLRKQTNGSCSEIVVNSQSFCIKDFECGQSAIIKLTNKTLIITLPVETSNFTELHYYNQVGACGKGIDLPDQPEVEQLSGVVASSYVQGTATSDCFIPIKNPPSPPVRVRFELLHSEGLNGTLNVANKDFSSTTSGSSLLADINTAHTTLTYYPDGSGSYNFLIRFQILHCGDVPHILNSVHDTTISPWLPGAQATYQCTDRWVLKNNKSSTVECLLDRSREIAEWSDDSTILCVSAPECSSPPTDIQHATYQLEGDNLTAVYQCIDGYESHSPDVSDRTVHCTSYDEKKYPYTWSSANFECSVECELTDSHENVTNGKVMKETYLYRDELQYECNVGYVRDVVVECTSDGSWSALPLCLPATGHLRLSPDVIGDPDNNTLVIAFVVPASVAVLVGVVVGLVCRHRKRKSASDLSSNDEDLAAAIALTGSENPYQTPADATAGDEAGSVAVDMGDQYNTIGNLIPGKCDGTPFSGCNQPNCNKCHGATSGVGNGTTPGVGNGTTPGVDNGTTPRVGNGTAPGVGNGTTPGVGNGTTSRLGNGTKSTRVVIDLNPYESVDEPAPSKAKPTSGADNKPKPSDVSSDWNHHESVNDSTPLVSAGGASGAGGSTEPASAPADVNPYFTLEETLPPCQCIGASNTDCDGATSSDSPLADNTEQVLGTGQDASAASSNEVLDNQDSPVHKQIDKSRKKTKPKRGKRSVVLIAENPNYLPIFHPISPSPTNDGKKVEAQIETTKAALAPAPAATPCQGPVVQPTSPSTANDEKNAAAQNENEEAAVAPAPAAIEADGEKTGAAGDANNTVPAGSEV